MPRIRGGGASWWFRVRARSLLIAALVSIVTFGIGGFVLYFSLEADAEVGTAPEGPGSSGSAGILTIGRDVASVEGATLCEPFPTGASSADYASRDATSVSAGIEEPTLVLDSLERSISGRVMSADGWPLSGVVIRVARPDRGNAPKRPRRNAGGEIVTDDQGRFVVWGLAAGEYTLETVSPDGYRSVRKNVISPLEGVDIVLARERRIVVFGSVTDVENHPVPGVAVSAVNASGSTVTGDRGAYSMEVKQSGGSNSAIILSARKRTYTTVIATVRMDEALEGPRGAEGIELSFEIELIENPATLLGRLLDPDGKPVAGERVHLRSASRNSDYSAATDSRGNFTVTDVVAGKDYRLRIHPTANYRDRIVYPLEVMAGENEVDIWLEPLEFGTLDAVLLDADGAPLPRFTVRLRPTQSVAKSIIVTTDQQGRFRATGLPSGQLVIETRALPRVTVSGLEIVAGDVRTVEIPIGLGDRTVRGVVRASDGTALPGARIYVFWQASRGTLRSRLYRETVSGERGEWAVMGLGPGSCSAKAKAPGYRSETVDFEIPVTLEMSELIIDLGPLD